MIKNLKNVLVVTGVAFGSFIVADEACGSEMNPTRENSEAVGAERRHEIVTLADLDRCRDDASYGRRWEYKTTDELPECAKTVITESIKSYPNFSKSMTEAIDRVNVEFLLTLRGKYGDNFQIINWACGQAITDKARYIEDFLELSCRLDNKYVIWKESGYMNKWDKNSLALTYCSKLKAIDPAAIGQQMNKLTIIEQLATIYHYLDRKEDLFFFMSEYLLWINGCAAPRVFTEFCDSSRILDKLYPGWKEKAKTIGNS